MLSIEISLGEIENAKVRQSWHESGRQNFVIKKDNKIICLEFKKVQETSPDKKITFKLEPEILYNDKHPVYRN